MPYVASIGTYLPCWGALQHRVAGDDEDAITLAVEAGRAALIASGAVERVVLVSRDLPLLESSNAAVLLAGLGLGPRLGGGETLGAVPPRAAPASATPPRPPRHTGCGQLRPAADTDHRHGSQPGGCGSHPDRRAGAAGSYRGPGRAHPPGAHPQRHWRRARLRRPAAAA